MRLWMVKSRRSLKLSFSQHTPSLDRKMINSSTTTISCEALEAECNVLGMELLNVLEFIGDTIDYRKITSIVQKLSSSMDLIANGTARLKNIEIVDLDRLLQEKKADLQGLQKQLEVYQQMAAAESDV